MLYQKMLTGDKPYYTALRSMTYFKKHKHPEIEIAYCLEGEYDVIINNVNYHIKEGDFVIIGSMISHEILCDELKKNLVLVIEVGPIMMENYFSIFSKSNFPNPVINLNSDSHGELKNLLSDMINLLKNFTNFAELSIKGNLYKIFGCLLRDFVDENEHTFFSKKMRSVSLVETAMEYIRIHYNEQIKVETIASVCGYSESNFCKTFKQIFGKTFHGTLNDYRVNIACIFLTETNDSIEDITTKVGFLDAKSFCRVFKQKKGISPKQYRKHNIE